MRRPLLPGNRVTEVTDETIIVYPEEALFGASENALRFYFSESEELRARYAMDTSMRPQKEA